MKYINCILISLTFVFMVSCGDESREELAKEVTLDEVSLVTYELDVKPIMSKHCISCHTSPPQFGAPFSLEAFDLVNNNAIKINMRVGEGTMPPSGAISQSEKDIINPWITNGKVKK